jgi:hypothetical protein
MDDEPQAAQRRRGARALPRGGGWALAAAAVVVAAVFPGSALANNLSISGSMEGSVRISNGDHVSAGYVFTIPGSHPDTHVVFAGAQVLFSGTCSNGSAANTLAVKLSPGPAGGYEDPANSPVKLPSNNEASPETYEGSVIADVCGGGSATLNASAGASFSAEVQADQTANQLQVQFHYRDPSAKGKGNYECSAASSASLGADVCGASWSATVALAPRPIPALPTCATPPPNTPPGCNPPPSTPPTCATPAPNTPPGCSAPPSTPPSCAAPTSGAASGCGTPPAKCVASAIASPGCPHAQVLAARGKAKKKPHHKKRKPKARVHHTTARRLPRFTG